MRKRLHLGQLQQGKGTEGLNWADFEPQSRVDEKLDVYNRIEVGM